ncbi:esterase [Actinoplanes awajinensis subsp. mycoplanecinus]|uniref:Esterase n=2 Tax=Actinoplanes awajinensis TaxID=135946 RepID=A0A0X3V9X6_9ACTN|nr:esterase [Actinoplanes awajinensis subsp. mycoplanecinus]
MVRTALVAALSLLIGAAGLVVARPAAAASLVPVTGFGANPTNLKMYTYVPDRVAATPALLVLVHYCGGSAGAIAGGNGKDFLTAADRYGFVVVLPEATRSEKCFDVSSPQALRRDGGSDSTGIMSMVSWARARYHVDSARIVVSGFSSGAMMTTVLAAQYPDVFTAASAFSGVPAGCFATTNGSLWNSTCSGGNLIKTARQWGDQARAMYPGYTGRYPRIQLWHGTTDTTLAYPNFGEEIKQWTDLHGLGPNPAFTDHPQSSWTRTRYGTTGTQATVEGVSIAGIGHQLPQTGQLGYAVSFLGLDGSTGTPSTSPSSSPSTSPPATGTCRVTASISSWNTGLTASLTVTNTGATAINGWTLDFTLPAGQSITSGWNATYAPATGRVNATNVAYNAAIPANGSIGIGFQAGHTGAVGAPTGFALNGTACGG